MPLIAQQIADDILHLPMSDRAFLAHCLIRSLDFRPDEQNDLEAESLWMKEIERRSEEIKENRVNCRPIGDVISNIREKLKNARSQPS